MIAAVVTSLSTAFAALVAAGLIALFRLGSSVRALQVELAVRFEANTDAHRQIRLDLQDLKECQRETDKNVDIRLISSEWREKHG